MVGTLTLGVFIGAINGWLVAYLKAIHHGHPWHVDGTERRH